MQPPIPLHFLPTDIQTMYKKSMKKHTIEEVQAKVDPLNMDVAKLAVVVEDIEKLHGKLFRNLQNKSTKLTNQQKNLIRTSAELTGLKKQVSKMAGDIGKAQKSGDAKKEAAVGKKVAKPGKALAEKQSYASGTVHDLEAGIKELDGDIRSYLAQMKALFGKL